MTNIIDPSFVHGENFKIGNFCIIEEGVVVGSNVTIENYVLLKQGTVIGDNVFIDSYVRSSGKNKIGSNVILRYGTTIAKEVIIEDDVFISPNVMTVYSSPTSEETFQTTICKGAYIGTAAVIGPGIQINPKVIVGAMSFVNKDCPETGIYVGIPAKKIEG